MICNILLWVDGSSSWSTTFCFEWTAAAPDLQHSALSRRQQPLIYILFWVDGSSPWSTTFCFEWTAAAPDPRHFVLSGRQQPMIYNNMFWVDGSSPWSTTFCFWVDDSSPWATTFSFEWTAAAPDLQHSVLSGRQQPLIYDILFWVDGSSPFQGILFRPCLSSPLIIVAIQFPSIGSPQHHVIVFTYMIYLFL